MRNLVLDIGGVLYLSHADPGFFERWSARCGLPAAVLAGGLWYGPDVEAANVGTIAVGEYCARASARLAIDAAIVGEMIEAAFTGGFNRDLAQFVRSVRARGVGVCGLTNSWYSKAELMARPALSSLFDFVVSSSDVGVTKPAEEIYHLLVRRLACASEDIVLVDDTAACIETARALGFRTVLFEDTQRTIGALRSLLGE